ncbi:MAG: ATP-binding protein [Parachlamydiaceae bacterium]
MYQRAMMSELKKMAKDYPVVTITGPRQSGKTTLVRDVFKKKPYVNLESIHIRNLALEDPIAFLEGYPDGAILDEIQRVPQLLSYLQVKVDEKKQKGMFILTGSHQLELHQAISQSLAGRTALLRLLPMSLSELQRAGIEPDLNELLCLGGYPRVYSDHLNSFKAYNNYIETYIERDLRQLIEVKDLHLFQQFLKLCAGRIGQILNKESLSNDVGVSAKTIGHWISILEASYIVFQLFPYFENFGKRVIKSPKLYFYDVGVAATLLGIENSKQMERDPLRGNLFENLVILEFMKERFNQGLPAQIYFYRDSQQREVDLIVQRGHELIPIEIKSSKTFNTSFLDGLKVFKEIVGERCENGFLIYAGEEEQKLKNFSLLNYQNVNKIV